MKERKWYEKYLSGEEKRAESFASKYDHCYSSIFLLVLLLKRCEKMFLLLLLR